MKTVKDYMIGALHMVLKEYQKRGVPVSMDIWSVGLTLHASIELFGISERVIVGLDEPLDLDTAILELGATGVTNLKQRLAAMETIAHSNEQIIKGLLIEGEVTNE